LTPFDILGSTDGRRFKRLLQVSDRTSGVPWKIDLAGQRTRFVRLQSGRTGVLSFAEVEIFAVVKTATKSPEAELPGND
jgi:hypothetical protein